MERFLPEVKWARLQVFKHHERRVPPTLMICLTVLLGQAYALSAFARAFLYLATASLNAPDGRPITLQSSSKAKVLGMPRVGGLHHRYEWREAA